MEKQTNNIFFVFSITFRGDVYLLCKFLTCKYDQRVYNIREKQLMKLLSRYLNCSHQELIEDLEKGDHSQTTKDVNIKLT